MNKTYIYPLTQSYAKLSNILRHVTSSLLKTASVLLFVACGTAAAQSTGMNSASNMWGTAPGSGAGGVGLESALMNAANSNIAAAAQSAKDGILYAPGTSITIQSIGSQNIVSNSINGSNNSTSIDASQSSSNQANVSNQGAVNQIKP